MNEYIVWGMSTYIFGRTLPTTLFLVLGLKLKILAKIKDLSTSYRSDFYCYYYYDERY